LAARYAAFDRQSAIPYTSQLAHLKILLRDPAQKDYIEQEFAM